jgi:hypothetical protein
VASLSGLRSALATALATEGLPLLATWKGEPPFVMQFFNGSDLDPLPGDGKWFPASLNVIAVVAKPDDEAAMLAADDVISDVLMALIGLDGWRINSVSPLERRTMPDSGDAFYTVTFNVSAMADLS